MVELVFNFLIKLLGKFVPISIRWYFTPNKISNAVKINIAPEGNGVEFWGGELPYIQTWIVLTNLSAFPIELERAYGTISFGAPVCQFFCPRRIAIAAASEERLMVNVSLSELQAEYIKKSQNSVEKIVFDFHAYFLCAVNNFPLQRYLETTHFKLVNFHLPIRSST